MKQRVLVVDDDSNLRELVRCALYEMGYQATSARSGNEALRMLSEGAMPHLVLTDYQMEDGDGYFLLRSMREHDNCKGLPVVLMTGTANCSIAAEFSAILKKPFSEIELGSVLRRTLPKHS